MWSGAGNVSSGFGARLREELSFRAREFAIRKKLASCESYGQAPVVCYEPSEDGLGHGNFHPQSYAAILKNPAWNKRLEKVHTQGRSSLPSRDRRWRELDSCNSSDALLMNIFCYPGTLRERRVFDLLGVEYGATPLFGYPARVPFSSGRADRTEVDMRLGDLLVEAKLTESDFQSREAQALEAYRDLHDVFDVRKLPRDGGRYLGYQLIRNVLAAYADACSFCVMADERRPDLQEAWYSVMQSVRSAEMRVRCKMLTWQELAEAVPVNLQKFLEEKYGIFTSSALRRAANF
jgi:restriction endonuclease-like protein